MTRTDVAKLAALLRDGEWHALYKLQALFGSEVSVAIDVLYCAGIIRQRQAQNVSTPDQEYQWIKETR